jgi:peroxiredoxin Q/BCP
MSVGDTAPSFALESDDGKIVHVHDFKGRPVVLFFYPGDFTSVCTKEGAATSLHCTLSLPSLLLAV